MKKLPLIGLTVVQGKWHAVTCGDLGAVPRADFCGRSRAVQSVLGGRGPAHRTRGSWAVVAADFGRDGVLHAARVAACLHLARVTASPETLMVIQVP